MPPRSSRMSVVQTKVAIGLLLSAVALAYPTAAVASDDSFQKVLPPSPLYPGHLPGPPQADMVVPETSLVEVKINMSMKCFYTMH